MFVHAQIITNTSSCVCVLNELTRNNDTHDNQTAQNKTKENKTRQLIV